MREGGGGEGEDFGGDQEALCVCDCEPDVSCGIEDEGLGPGGGSGGLGGMRGLG